MSVRPWSKVRATPGHEACVRDGERVSWSEHEGTPTGSAGTTRPSWAATTAERGRPGQGLLDRLGQARDEEGECEGYHGPRKPTERTLEGREQCLLVELTEGSVVENERAVHAGDVAPDEASRRAEAALCIRE